MRANQKHSWVSRSGSLLLLILLLLASPSLAGCSDAPEETAKPADYGFYGSNLAQKLADKFPYRSPGSEQEKDAGDYIVQCFKALGYQPIITEFSFQDTAGTIMMSRNIVVVIPGRGFTQTDEKGQIQDLDRRVIVGAHYDTEITAEQAAAAIEAAQATATSQTGEETQEETSAAGTLTEPTLADYDGIHDNASGIGALLTIARELKNQTLGYEVILIAFGGGTANQAGARFYASQMDNAEIAATDAMYCLDSIYAGDKVYAHSGRNSIRSGYKKNYEKRRKLYEATDIFYENELYTNNSYMLYTNQASFDVTLEGFFDPVLYREWSLNQSDYVPFDDLGVPIVFFESYNFDEDTLEAMKESLNPAFGPTSGKIRGTQFDSSEFLEKLLNTTQAAAVTGAADEEVVADKLTRRINNTAFIVVEAIRSGVTGAEMR